MAIRRASSSDSSPRKWPKQLGRAMGFQTRPARIGRAIEDGADLGQHARLQHGVEATLDAGAQPAALGRQQHRREAPAHRLAFTLLPGAERPAGRQPDFPGADMALAIAGFQPRHDRRILLGKSRAEGVGAHRLPVRIGLSRRPGGADREWRRCPASTSGDKGPSRRTGWACGPRPGSARSLPQPGSASARPTGSPTAATRRRAGAARRPALARWAARSGSGRHRRSAWRRH